jgi:hypothetical protein
MLVGAALLGLSLWRLLRDAARRRARVGGLHHRYVREGARFPQGRVLGKSGFSFSQHLQYESVAWPRRRERRRYGN